MVESEILQHTRWEIINQIGRGRTTAREIANGAKTSLPNISQQLRLLEAHNLIERVSEKKNLPGKPRQNYHIRRPFCQLTLASNQGAEQTFFFTNDIQHAILSTFSIPIDEQPFLIKGLFQHDELLEECSIAYVRSGEAIELLLITENVDKIRNHFSNITISFGNKARKLVAWTHSVKEIREGIENHDEHFVNLMRHKVIHDPAQRFRQVKE